jgi:hypothetical protein
MKKLLSKTPSPNFANVTSAKVANAPVMEKSDLEPDPIQ